MAGKTRASPCACTSVIHQRSLKRQTQFFKNKVYIISSGTNNLYHECKLSYYNQLLIWSWGLAARLLKIPVFSYYKAAAYSQSLYVFVLIVFAYFSYLCSNCDHFVKSFVAFVDRTLVPSSLIWIIYSLI